MRNEVIKIKTKTVIKEAMLFDGTKESAEAVRNWITGVRKPEITPNPKYVEDTDNKAIFRLTIQTLEGPYLASPGDYIIRGVEGEFYPCKPEILKKSYTFIQES